MSDNLKNITDLLKIIAGGIIIVGGAYIVYKISQSPTGEGIGDIFSGAGDLVQTVTNTLYVDPSKTKGLYQECVNNAECSASGIAGGNSIGIDLFRQQPISCCYGKCLPNERGELGYRTCPMDREGIYPGLGEPVSKLGNCSISGKASAQKTLPGNNPMNIYACNGKCEILTDAQGNKMPANTDPKKLYCKGKREPITKALGSACSDDSQCSVTEVSDGPPANASSSIGCIKSICARRADQTSPLGGDCDTFSDCSETGFRRDPPAKSDSAIGCFRNKCSIKANENL